MRSCHCSMWCAAFLPWLYRQPEIRRVPHHQFNGTNSLRQLFLYPFRKIRLEKQNNSLKDQPLSPCLSAPCSSMKLPTMHIGTERGWRWWSFLLASDTTPFVKALHCYIPWGKSCFAKCSEGCSGLLKTMWWGRHVRSLRSFSCRDFLSQQWAWSLRTAESEDLVWTPDVMWTFYVKLYWAAWVSWTYWHFYKSPGILVRERKHGCRVLWDVLVYLIIVSFGEHAGTSPWRMRIW